MKFTPKHRKVSKELTADEELSLICGAAWANPPAFATEEEMRTTWLANSDHLREQFGHACWAEWFFDIGQFPGPAETNLGALLRLGIAPTPVDYRTAGVRTRGSMEWPVTDFDNAKEKARTFYSTALPRKTPVPSGGEETK